MTGRSPSTGRPAREVRLCESCREPLLSHVLSCPSHRVFSIENLAENLIAASLASVPETRVLLLPADGSSSTTRGARASRSWSVTGSSGSVCRRLRRAKSASTSRSGPSTAGTGTGRTSASSRSSSEADDITGTVEVTLVEYGTPHVHVVDVSGTCRTCGRVWR